MLLLSSHKSPHISCTTARLLILNSIPWRSGVSQDLPLPGHSPPTPLPVLHPLGEATAHGPHMYSEGLCPPSLNTEYLHKQSGVLLEGGVSPLSHGFTVSTSTCGYSSDAWCNHLILHYFVAEIISVWTSESCFDFNFGLYVLIFWYICCSGLGYVLPLW